MLAVNINYLNITDCLVTLFFQLLKILQFVGKYLDFEVKQFLEQNNVTGLTGLTSYRFYMFFRFAVLLLIVSFELHYIFDK